MCQIGCSYEDFYGDCEYKKKGENDLYPCEAKMLAEEEKRKQDQQKAK